MNVFHPLSTAAVMTSLLSVHIHTFLDSSYVSEELEQETIAKQELLFNSLFFKLLLVITKSMSPETNLHVFHLPTL